MELKGLEGDYKAPPLQEFDSEAPGKCLKF